MPLELHLRPLPPLFADRTIPEGGNKRWSRVGTECRDVEIRFQCVDPRFSPSFVVALCFRGNVSQAGSEPRPDQITEAQLSVDSRPVRAFATTAQLVPGPNIGRMLPLVWYRGSGNGHGKVSCKLGNLWHPTPHILKVLIEVVVDVRCPELLVNHVRRQKAVGLDVSRLLVRLIRLVPCSPYAVSKNSSRSN